MKIKIYQIDAFTDKLFAGNPAAVCPLDYWLEDKILQNIAIENNLAETAFFVQIASNQFHLRWFTPEFEMDLCGHATLAAAYVLFEYLGCQHDEIMFETQGGHLSVKKVRDHLELSFPSRPPNRADLPKTIVDGLNIQPKEIWKARDYLLVYDSEDEIKRIAPNRAIFDQINIDPGGIIVTAQGHAKDVDFVSRLFTPQATVFEDPVTGSAHCTLVPFWADRLNKTEFRALQLSKRGGELWCKLDKESVLMRGKAVKYFEGTVEL